MVRPPAPGSTAAIVMLLPLGLTVTPLLRTLRLSAVNAGRKVEPPGSLAFASNTPPLKFSVA